MQFRDLKKQYEVLKEGMDAAIGQVLTESNYISVSSSSATCLPLI